jgi:hypothetical protein
MGNYKEAVEHFLSALAIQQENLHIVSSEFGQDVGGDRSNMLDMHSISSNGIWSTLRSVLLGYSKCLLTY